MSKFELFWFSSCVVVSGSSARPQFASANFALMTTFPNRELTDETQTLATANLLNAVLVQKSK